MLHLSPIDPKATMSDPFAALIPDARRFLSDLARNNSRDWFAAHKPDYDAALKAPATLLMDQIAHDLSRDPGWTVRPKLFRAHRDVRFSKDKTPYHTHLHMLWVIQGRGVETGLFFGISPDYVKAGGGVMAFDKEALMRWRAFVDAPTGATFETLCADLARDGLTPDAPALKRVPPTYDKNHPRGDLLKRKGMTLWRDIPAARWDAPMAELRDTFNRLHPFLSQLQTI